MNVKLLKCLTIVLMSIVLFSCSNFIDTKDENVDTISSLRTENIEEYNALAPDEQKQFWIDRVTNFSSAVSLSSIQEDVINVLLDFLEGSDFSDPDLQVTANSFAEAWMDEALSVFSIETIGLLVSTPIREYTDIVNYFNGDTPTYAVGGSGGSGGSGGTSDCDCNVGSIFGACALIGDDCEEKKGCEGSKGCGFLGLWTCNGECNGGPTGGQSSSGASVYSFYYYVPYVTLLWQ